MNLDDYPDRDDGTDTSKLCTRCYKEVSRRFFRYHELVLCDLCQYQLELQILKYLKGISLAPSHEAWHLTRDAMHARISRMRKRLQHEQQGSGTEGT